jgi:transposase
MGGSHDEEELAIQTVTTIGLDIAKSVFQVRGVDAAGRVVIRRQPTLALRAANRALDQKKIGIIRQNLCPSSEFW